MDWRSETSSNDRSKENWGTARPPQVRQGEKTTAETHNSKMEHITTLLKRNFKTTVEPFLADNLTQV